MKEEGYAPIVYVQSGCEAPSNRDTYVQVRILLKEYLQGIKGIRQSPIN